MSRDHIFTKFVPPLSIRTRAIEWEFHDGITTDVEDVEDKEDEGIGKDDDDDEVDEPLPCQMCMTVPSMLCAGSHPEGRQRVREQKARQAWSRGGLMCRSGSL